VRATLERRQVMRSHSFSVHCIMLVKSTLYSGSGDMTVPIARIAASTLLDLVVVRFA
jgi:hypothetical protein